MFTRDCDGCGVAGHGCGVENPDPRVTRDEPYKRFDDPNILKQNKVKFEIFRGEDI